ncbi:TPA: DUF2207 domain-containing protein [bacterium]|nr:DUF2207 domain-containing protein [bacterium]
MIAKNLNNYKIVIIILIIFIFSFPNMSFAKSWHFVKWISDITINPDSTFIVRETQSVQFVGQFSFFQRGIELRNIRKISDVAIYDEIMNPLPTSQYSVKRSGNEIVIRINFNAQDEVRTWTFEYKVHGGIGFFDDFDEIYWNSISQNRDVSIDHVTVIVHLPQSVPLAKLRQKLFIGPEGSRNESNTYLVADDRTLAYWGQNIPPHTHFTIVGSFPKGIVEKDWIPVIYPFLWFLIPIISFLFLFGRWQNRVKEQIVRNVIIPQHEPPEGLTPAEMGIIVTERLNVRYISATIIDLAYKGYLKIIDNGITSDNYTFEKQKDIIEDNRLKRHEKLILNGIFGIYDKVDLYDLKEKFYTNIAGIRKSLFEQTTWDGYFTKNPEKVRAKYMVIGTIAIIITIILGVLHVIPITGIFGIIVTAIMILIFGNVMPHKTQKGSEIKWHSLGFKEYLMTSDKFHHESNIDPKTFDKYLPYAIVFGVSLAWANRFAHIYTAPSDWYMTSSDYNSFSFINFSSGISQMEHSFSSVLPSSPSSSSGSDSGGSSSGGGGGGGSSSAG